MNSNRLSQITFFINKSDRVIDVGCDHALLDIYLIQNDICQSSLASDISENALKAGIKNIKNAKLEKKIPTVISDGLMNIDTSNYNTIVISGMGAHTIMDILSEKKKLRSINKIIIQSNNEWPLIRKFMNKIGYYLLDESIVKDRNHYYSVMKFIKKNKKNSPKIIKYGIYKINNLDYYRYRIYQNNDILKMIKNDIFKKIKVKTENRTYHKYFKKITGRKWAD